MMPCIPYLSYLSYIPHIPYICNIIATPTIHTIANIHAIHTIPTIHPYFPNMPYQTDHTHHTYPTYHTTPPPHHRGGGGQYHTPTTPQGGRGKISIWDPSHAGGGRGGVAGPGAYIYIYDLGLWKRGETYPNGILSVENNDKPINLDLFGIWSTHAIFLVWNEAQPSILGVPKWNCPFWGSWNPPFLLRGDHFIQVVHIPKCFWSRFHGWWADGRFSAASSTKWERNRYSNYCIVTEPGRKGVEDTMQCTLV